MREVYVTVSGNIYNPTSFVIIIIIYITRIAESFYISLGCSNQFFLLQLQLIFVHLL